MGLNQLDLLNYYNYVLPSDNVQHELQRRSFRNIQKEERNQGKATKKEAYARTLLYLPSVRIYVFPSRCMPIYLR